MMIEHPYRWYITILVMFISCAQITCKKIKEDDAQRLLSKQDRVIFEGTWEVSHLPPSLVGINYRFLHIPKNGGSSFLSESAQFIPVHSTLKGNKEKSLLETDPIRNITATILRSPRSHVLSQYMECKYDDWGQKVTRQTNFPGNRNKEKPLNGLREWIEHFLGDSWYSEYNCYNPWNMQTRYLATKYSHKLPHQHPGLKEPDVEIAKKEVDRLGFVGIMEQADITICLLQYWVARTVSSRCKCGKEMRSN